MRTSPRVSGWLGALVLIGFATLAAHAEVSVLNDGDAPPNTLLMAITDHPDPIGQIAWLPIVPENEEQMLNPDGYIRGDAGPTFDWWRHNSYPIAVWSFKTGTVFDIAVAEWKGSFWEGPIFLDISSQNDLDPRVAIDDDSGQIYVVWWQDAPVSKVFLSTRDSDGQWSLPEEVTPTGQQGKRPSVIVHQGVVYVAYERNSTSGGDNTVQEVVVAQKQQNSFTTTLVAETLRLERLDPVLHQRNDKLWVDWKHDVDRFGRSENDGSGWMPPVLTNWNDPTWIGVEEARKQIESEVNP